MFALPNVLKFALLLVVSEISWPLQVARNFFDEFSWFYWNRTASQGINVCNLLQNSSRVNKMHCKQIFLEVSLVRIHCYGLTHLWSVIHTRSVLNGNVTKRNINTKDQESVQRASVSHNNDTSSQSYTLTLNVKFKGLGTKSNNYCQPLFKVLVFINWHDRTYISWYRWKRFSNR